MYQTHCFTFFNFTGGIIAISHIESVNASLKYLLYYSNISLYKLIIKINRLLDIQDKENEYRFQWLTILAIKNQNKENFLFNNVDNCIKRFLILTILQMQRNEINQSIYYTANVITREVSENSDQNIKLNDNQKEFNVDDAQIIFNQLIDFIGSENIQEIQTIKVDNTLKVKHHIYC